MGTQEGAARAANRAGNHADGNGALLIIGGAEDRTNGSEILRLFAERTGKHPVAVVTLATEEPEQSFAEYRDLFRDLGIPEVRHVDVRDRSDALNGATDAMDGVGGVFFTGGDQLRLTSGLGDTPVFRRTEELVAKGGIVAGTSAGAAVMSETMIVNGSSGESHRIGDVIAMAPGFALVPGVIIDQHFAERGRITRLLGAVAQNPRILGVGIDENTAILVEGRCFTVHGEGAVYVIDGSTVTHSNLNEAKRDETMSMSDVTLHVLSRRDAFDLDARRPIVAGRRHPAPQEAAAG